MREKLHTAAELSTQTQLACWEAPFRLESGTMLPGLVLAFRTWGRLNPSGDNAVLVCHALSGSADADEWWPGLFGTGRALDPERDFIICSNILGGCYGTSGPLHPHPDDGLPWGSRFPEVTIRDIVRAQAMLVDRLGVRRLALVLGASLGGMQVLEWAAMFSGRIERMAPIGVSGRHSAWCIGLNEAQRQAIFADPQWKDGRYAPGPGPTGGLAVARMMAMCSYRSWYNFEARFGRRLQPDQPLFQVASYLRHQGKKLQQRFDPCSYVRITQAMDSHDLGRGRGDYRDVLRDLSVPALVISISSDILYPPQEQRELADHLQEAIYHRLMSPAGHDGFLIETDALNDLLVRFRAGTLPAPPAASLAAF
ncbi:MAG: homoserine O-acetyltransferase [Chromatiales bacterium]|nr:homoserine O-acetyltransferase [Chromatiales bacterium]